jgi:hypothetical protein
MGDDFSAPASEENVPPNISSAELECYRRHLTTARAVLEYGAGGSTVLAAQSGVASLYTVDTDPAWLATVQAHPAVARMITSGKATLAHIDLGETKRWGKPRNKLGFWRWPRYAARPWLDGFRPDLVLVDGRFRVSCIMRALRDGGEGIKIAVHDFQRRHYQPALQFASVLDKVDNLVVLQPRPAARQWRANLFALRHRYDTR